MRLFILSILVSACASSCASYYNFGPPHPSPGTPEFKEALNRSMEENRQLGLEAEAYAKKKWGYVPTDEPRVVNVRVIGSGQ